MIFPEVVGWISGYLLLGLVLAEILQRRGFKWQSGAPKLDGPGYIAVTLFWLPMVLWILFSPMTRRK